MSDGEDIGPTPGDLTPYLRLDEVLINYAQTSRDVLHDNFVGLYLLGSLAIGDFDLTSDVDFMIATKDELSDEELNRVRSAHMRFTAQDTRWVKHFEYSFFSMRKLDAKSSPYLADGSRNESEDRQIWYFDNGARTPVRSDHDNTLVSRWTLRYRSPAVLGPEPATFAPEVTADELRREIRSSMLGWEKLVIGDASPFDNRFHQVFLVLNNCRALEDLHEGRITSKKEGVNWARKHLDPEWQALIDYCWKERQDTGINISQPADPEAFKQTIAFMKYTARLAEAYRLPSTG
jgi:predicted nucleotidyltransferase